MQIPLIGRDQDLATLQHRLVNVGPRLITVTGPGGVGKTRLAMEVAAGLSGDFDEITVVRLDQDLANHRETIAASELVLSAVARKLRLPEGSDRPLLAQLVHVIGQQRHLLLLDNFEHVLGAAPAIGELIAGCPHLSILATSRELLGIQSENAYELGPLGSAHHPHPTLLAVERSSAGALFLEHAKTVNPIFSPSDADALALAVICRRLGGLPLALELAAARISVLTPAELLIRLDRHLLRILQKGDRDVPSRLLSVRDSVAWGYELLEPREQEFFRRLSIFVGGFTLEAAVIIADADDDLWVEHALESLIAKHMVQRIAPPQDQPRSDILKPRFGMLEPIREFAIDQLESSEREDAEQRRARWCVELCARVSPNLFSSHLYGEHSLAWEQRLDEEYGTLRTTLGWALEAGDAETALRLGGTLADFWYRRCYLTEGHSWLRAIRPLVANPTAAEIKVLTGAALIAESRGHLVDAAACSGEAHRLARQSNNVWAKAEALAIHGHVLAAQGDHGKAYAHHKAALRLFREVSDASWMSATLHNLALSALRLGEFSEASTFAAESLALARDAGDLWMIVNALHGVAAVACCEGDAENASVVLSEALALSQDRSAAGRWRLADALASCAMLAWLQKEPERAARLFGAAEARYGAAGVNIPPPDMPMYATTKAAVLGVLGAQAILFFQQGENLSYEACLAEAETLLAPRRVGGKSQLSAREAEVLRMIALGMSDKDIAATLQISVRTAEDHAQKIRDKLGVATRTRAVAEARRRGLL